ncbi:hypothetical protein P167DRAFT_13582 [Morchella conica CCBAS932]|uniref:Uncharacterized protein n=1 Tax=Morchella conica CCBAS932 TaxID=1392247 RepID=A0A3N4L4H5_9PEZI|nr:hypothetical protein P167DRAFT_13582 [Morchella conica CCBAS932]
MPGRTTETPWDMYSVKHRTPKTIPPPPCRMYVRPPLNLAVCLSSVANTTITVHHDSPTLHPSETAQHHLSRRSSHPLRFVPVPPHCTATTAAGHRTTHVVGFSTSIQPFSPPPSPLNPSHQFHFIPLHPMTYITVPRCLTPPLQRHGTAVSIDQLRLDGFFVCTHPKCPYWLLWIQNAKDNPRLLIGVKHHHRLSSHPEWDYIHIGRL